MSRTVVKEIPANFHTYFPFKCYWMPVVWILSFLTLVYMYYIDDGVIQCVVFPGQVLQDFSCFETLPSFDKTGLALDNNFATYLRLMNENKVNRELNKEKSIILKSHNAIMSNHQ